MLEEAELDTRMTARGAVCDTALALRLVGPVVGAIIETGDACGRARTQVG